MVVSPRDAFLGEAEVVPVDDAVGRVSCESIAGYPPGIPALLPGERITAETVAYLRELVELRARACTAPATRRSTHPGPARELTAQRTRSTGLPVTVRAAKSRSACAPSASG